MSSRIWQSITVLQSVAVPSARIAVRLPALHADHGCSPFLLLSGTAQPLAHCTPPLSRPASPLQVDPRPVPHSFFSDRSEYISADLSRRIVNGLRKIGMLDAAGFVTTDPRYTTQAR